MHEGAAARGLALVDGKPPPLHPRQRFYWEAFQELSTCRPMTMGGAGPIPWTAMLAYAQAHDLSDEQTDRLRILVRAMDSAFLDHLRKPANV